MIKCQSFQGVKGSHQDQTCQRTLAPKVSGHATADAEAHSDHLSLPLVLQMIEHRQRIGEHGLGTRRSAAWGVAPVVEGNDLLVRKDAVQVKRHDISVPGIASKAENEAV